MGNKSANKKEIFDYNSNLIPEYKVIFFGYDNVGKTALINQYLNRPNPLNTTPTIGVKN